MSVTFKYYDANDEIQSTEIPILDLVAAGDYDTLGQYSDELERIVYFDDFVNELTYAFITKVFGDDEVVPNNGVAQRIPDQFKNLMTATYNYLAEIDAIDLGELDITDMIAGAVATGDLELLSWLCACGRFESDDALNDTFLGVLTTKCILFPHPDALQWYFDNISSDREDYDELEYYADDVGMTYVPTMLDKMK